MNCLADKHVNETYRKDCGMLLILILAKVLVLCRPCFTQTITLSVEPQKGCWSGALASEHKVKIICTIYFGKSTENWSEAVVINITKTSKENKSIVVDPNGIISENVVKDHSCSYINKGTYSEVTCEILARKDLSAANIIAYIGHLDLGSISSGNEKFPFVYDRDDIRMSVNGYDITSNSCLINISHKEQDITLCCENSPSPCTAEIRRRGGALLNAHDKCATYRDRPAVDVQYELSLRVCDEPTPVKSNICDTTVTTADDDSIGCDGSFILILKLVKLVTNLFRGNWCWPIGRKSTIRPRSDRPAGTHLIHP
ncbi:hypothetical protein Btru_069095 [Bulinus truncatus]|nr:hypothetical protein Btru_069095 [Bulinus truncatus]